MPLTIELCKNSITLDTEIHKRVPLLFSQFLRETLADFNNFWHMTLKRNLMQMSAFLATSPYGCCYTCLLYTSDAADEEDSVDLGGRRIIKKKNI